MTSTNTVTIYHNPRCSKSRAALNLLEEAGADIHIILYMQHPPKLSRLEQLLELLGNDVRAMLRSSEAVYKELGLDDPALLNTELLSAIAAHPQLLQRPIVCKGNKAIIARPPDLVHEIIQ